MIDIAPLIGSMKSDFKSSPTALTRSPREVAMMSATEDSRTHGEAMLRGRSMPAIEGPPEGPDGPSASSCEGRFTPLCFGGIQMAISFVRKLGLLGASTGLLVGCSPGMTGEPATSTAASAITLGGHLAGITDADFAEARDNFNLGETIDDGVGPVFNETACGNCHTNGAQGGAGEQIERRYGRVTSGIFHELPNEGGTLRQLKTLGTFSNGTRTCTVPLEVEPADATVRNVGRLTTPLFGLGLVDAMPDSFFTSLVAAQPANIRGVVNRVPVVLPNPGDPTQSINSVRVGRFGWKSGIATLLQFSADAYSNEMAITTQSCFHGSSVNAFAVENAPNAPNGSVPA